MIEILKDEWLENFFNIANEEFVIKRRENFFIEFKEVFEWNEEKARSNYCKSLAAFANNKGGALFFGVKNSPHQIIGIENFDNIDDADISNYINEIFSPHIDFERRTYEFKGRTIGIIYAYSSTNKPIVCCKDSSKTHSSDIYYRYGAKSSKIKHGDLITLMNEIREEESNKWIKLFQNVSKIGINNLNVLNTANGEIIGNNHTFLLDETLLKQIKVIDKYSINEEGEPAVKIIGEIPELTKVITKSKIIYEEDIYLVFLTGVFKVNAFEYIKSICLKNTSTYPIYFFFKKLDKNADEAIEILKNLKIRNKVRIELIGRLEDDSKTSSKLNKYTLESTSRLGPIRKQFYDNIVNNRTIEINSENECKLFLESLYSLKQRDYDIDKLKEILKNCFDRFYPFNKTVINYLFRDALTYIDYLNYKE